MIKRLMSVSTLVVLGGFTMAQAASSPIENDVYLVQQTTTCQGKVVDENGEALIGASVVVKGNKTQGSITDVNGAFSIKGVAKGATLHVSYIGYKATDVKWNGTNLTVVLEEDANTLQEAVVVGYGTMKRSDISGASVSMKEEDIKGSLITNLDQAFQGRAAGVTSIQTSGAPGSSSSIRVRGQATINANAEPLYVIDGVIVQSLGSSGASLGLGDALGNGAVSTISPLSTIDPADIVSMEILKDASATAIYGAQGANGVVLITTKHGKEGDAKVTYNGMFAANRQGKRLDMMNLREYGEYYNSFVESGTIQPGDRDPHFWDTSLLGKGTNWQDAIFQTALQHSHQVNVQGGTEKVKYYASGSFMDQDGTIIGSNFNRYSFRANIDAQMLSWLKFGMNAAFSSSNDDLKLADSDHGLIYYSLSTPPNIPIYNVDGSYSSVSQEGFTSPNPIAIAMFDDIKLNRQKLNGNMFFDVTPIQHLTWHTELGYDLNWSKGTTYKPTYELGTSARQKNESALSNNSSIYWQLKNYVTYANTFGKHSMSGMVGQEMWESRWENMRIEGSELPSDDIHSPSLGTGTQKFSNGFGSAAMASFFTRWTYGYDNRYNATYTYRYDGSSNFGPKNRWAGFHSFAASWRFSQESWLKDSSWLSNGKLRAGWGQTGNSSIGGFLWGAGINRMESDLGLSFRPSNIPNPNVKWETQEQFNVGLDLGFFNDRLNLTVEWYRKESKDMLMNLQVPSYMGINENTNGSIRLEAPMGNYGDILNQGFEVTLDAHPFRGKFEWDINLVLTHNRNKLVSLNDGSGAGTLVGYGQWSDPVSLSREGESLYSFYGYKCDGVYKDLADLEASPKRVVNGGYNRTSTVWVGDIKYKDLSGPDGVPDGVINEYDRTNIGSPLPKITFGFNNTFRWKNWDLNIFLNGNIGNKILNYNAITLTGMNSIWRNQLVSVMGHAQLKPIDATRDYSGEFGYFVPNNPADEALVVDHTLSKDVQPVPGVNVYHWYDDVTNIEVSNPETNIPRTTLANPNKNTEVSDRYIEDGSYLRIKNIALGYTFPSSMLKKTPFEAIRIYANVQNLYTLTNYSGYDPEVGISTTSMNVYGLDNGRYPSPTTYSVGLQVTFGKSGKVRKAPVMTSPQIVEKIVEKEVIKEVPVEKIVEKVVEKQVPTAKEIFNGEDNLYFVIGKTELRADEAFKLGRLCEMLKENPGTKVNISGYADADTGTEEINTRLAKERAEVVKAKLVANGIEANRITTSSAIGTERVAVCIVK